MMPKKELFGMTGSNSHITLFHINIFIHNLNYLAFVVPPIDTSKHYIMLIPFAIYYTYNILRTSTVVVHVLIGLHPTKRLRAFGSAIDYIYGYGSLFCH